MKIFSLGSGSKGNAFAVECAGKWWLIDCGLSYKQMGVRLEVAGVRPDDIYGIILTHEHDDHTAGLKLFLKKHKNAGVYTTAPTLTALEGIGNVEGDLLFPHERYLFEGVLLTVFPVPHDAAAPCGVLVEDRNALESAAFVMDCGHVTQAVKRHLATVSHLVVEMNYDPEMLAVCPYHDTVVSRIKGPNGHLSNAEGLEIVRYADNPHMKTVTACHVSQNSNTYDLARELLEEQMNQLDRPDVKVAVAVQDEVLQIA